MPFLKKMVIQGFKSFGNEVTIPFDDQMVGIIGPNGAGKSNIVDALKWLIGEHSAKQLRGKKDDLLFNGNAQLKKATKMKVSCVFNNIDNIFNNLDPELKVTREYDQKTDTNKYFINDEEAKLSTITELFLNSGLLKGSLGILSQGTVSWFNDAKPIDRRKVFEEASGISKYTRKKEESIRDLDRANENLNRINDIVLELKKDLQKLEDQKAKFDQYQKLKNQLTDIELVITSRELKHHTINLGENEEFLRNTRNKISLITPDIDIRDEEIKKLVNDKDFSLAKYNQINDEIAKIKREIDQYKDEKNRTEILLTNQVTNASSVETKLAALKTLISNDQSTFETSKKDLDFFNKELEDKEKQYQAIRDLLTKFEDERNQSATSLRVEQTTLEKMENEYENMSSLEKGAKTILSNKDHIYGVIDTIGRLISTKEMYEVAVQTALGKAISNVVVKDNESAKKCVNFLKLNNGGYATFLPLKDIKAKEIKKEFIDILNTKKGFIDTANNLVKIKPEYKIAIDNLIGNIIIVDNLDNAEILSQFTYKNYKVITLDGSVIHSMGAVSGGSGRHLVSTLNLEQKIEDQKKKVEELVSSYRSVNQKYDNARQGVEDLTSEVNTIKHNIQRLNYAIEKLDEDISKWTSEYNVLSKSSLTKEDLKNSISLNQQKLDELSSSVLKKEMEATNFFNQYNSIQKTIDEKRSKYIKDKDTLNALKLEENKAINNIEINRREIEMNKSIIIEDYQLTPERAIEEYSNRALGYSDAQAKQQIKDLKFHLQGFKNINLNVLEDYSLKEKEFNEKNKELEECTGAVQDLLAIINDLDKKAKQDFLKIINETNEKLPEIFNYLFNGGSCFIRLEDEKNVLESGIEIIANPPGKKGVPLALLSGGERTLVVLTVLFTLLTIAKFPLVILDEAEAALDIHNVDKFGKLINKQSKDTQFLVISHRQGTWENCHSLLGIEMSNQGLSSFIKMKLNDLHDKYKGAQ